MNVPAHRLGSSPVHKAGTQSANDPFEFVLSDESVDRMGDVIRAKGWQLGDFKNNPVALLGHEHDKLVGVWENVRVQGKQLLGRLRFAEPGTSELIDTARKLVEQRILKAVSVGFIPLDGQPLKSGDGFGGFEYTQAALHEVSLVAVPANPNALAIAKAFCPPEITDALFVRPDAAGDLVGADRPVSTPKMDAMRAKCKALGIQYL